MMVSVSLFAGDTATITVTGNLLFSGDEVYSDIYGGSSFYPEFKGAVKIYKGLFVWVSYGFLSLSGQTPELGEDADSKQNFLGFGAGYKFDLSEKLGLKGELGLVSAGYEESSMGETVDGSTMGIMINVAVFHKLGDMFVAGLTLGYIVASDEIEDVTIKPGGFKAGIEIGVIL